MNQLLNTPEWDSIKAASEEHKIEIDEPKSSCRHCYGRGWIGHDSANVPVACNCIFRTKKDVMFQAYKNPLAVMNRKERRARGILGDFRR